jgi:hypothetical protein
MRAGPKVSPEQLEAKIVDLETRVLEYQELLLTDKSFVESGNRAKFSLSPRQTQVREAWRAWLQGELTGVPQVAGRLVLNPRPAAPEPKRRSGRPSRLARLMEEDRLRAEHIDRRVAELHAEWGVDRETALAIMADQVGIQGVSRVGR